MKLLKNNMLIISIFIIYFLVIQFDKESFAESVTFKGIDSSLIVYGDNNYVSSIRQYALQLPTGDVELDVNMVDPNNEEVLKFYGDEYLEYAGTSYKYELINNNIHLLIRPDWPYLVSYLNNEHIKSVDITFLPTDVLLFSSPPPTFDIRLINNTEKTINIKEIIIDVEKSYPHKEPLLVFFSTLDDIGKMLILNEGWSTIDKIQLQFDINILDISSKKTHHINISSFKNAGYLKNVAEIDYMNALYKEGVDTKLIKKLTLEGIYPSQKPDLYIKALGPFVSNKLRKEIELANKEADGFGIIFQISADVKGTFIAEGSYLGEFVSKKGSFSGKFPLSPPDGFGDAYPIQEAFEAEFKINAKNYAIRMPVSAYIKPFEGEKFLFRLGAFKSSWHNFSIKVALSNGKIVKSKPIKLYVFCPKSTYDFQVEQTQKYLHQLGYHFGKVDGVFGRITKNSIMKYQRKNRIYPIDGRVTQPLINILEKDMEKHNLTY